MAPREQISQSNHEPEAEKDFTNELAACRARVSAQGDKVRNLKKTNTEPAVLDAEVALLIELRKKLMLREAEVESLKPLYTRCRAQLENLAKRRSFFFPSFEIYGGVAGLFDFGPPGCALKAELEAFWRRFFVLEEDMLEISGTCLTPHAVLKTSGHVDRFCDLMTCDTVSGECYRADKLVEDFVASRLANKDALTAAQVEYYECLERRAGALSAEQLAEVFDKEKITAPITGNPLGYPFPFNLMFKTRLGPKEDETDIGKAYLRPETAQGIFVNFRRFLEYNGGKMPFAVAQRGLGFRNEIAPRNALLRVREFPMAEIEYFVDPQDKSHPKFQSVQHIKLPLFPRERQLTDGQLEINLTLREAVNTKIIANESLAYFMARVYQFVEACGIQHSGMRLRQHLTSEMAHYACDCWDLDIETSYGWVECVGIADRSAYDLTHHSKATKTSLVATRRYPEPRFIEMLQMVVNRPLMGKEFKKDNAKVLEELEHKPEQEKREIEQQLQERGVYALLTASGASYNITRQMVTFKQITQKVSEEAYVPAVIEPSFGIGRLIYCILEHTFRSREIQDQEERCYVALPPVVAPTKCSLLAISSNARFDALLASLKTQLTKRGISCKVDVSSASIGKRYARTDEIGIPFAVTVDFQSLQDETVTVRERDSMEQVRVPADIVGSLVGELLSSSTGWADACNQYPKFVEQTVQSV